MYVGTLSVFMILVVQVLSDTRIQITFDIVIKDSLGTAGAAMQHIRAFRILAADVLALVHSGSIPASTGRGIWEAITCSWKYRCQLRAIFLRGCTKT